MAVLRQCSALYGSSQLQPDDSELDLGALGSPYLQELADRVWSSSQLLGLNNEALHNLFYASHFATFCHELLSGEPTTLSF